MLQERKFADYCSRAHGSDYSAVYSVLLAVNRCLRLAVERFGPLPATPAEEKSLIFKVPTALQIANRNKANEGELLDVLSRNDG